ncbi:hypothetical protein N7541_001057 [Penicillium brevicompactum]|uniref:Uncharacterized protein n=1 Tax=Penicillium brevicompactum TaxID=5074 RepID=A0A9W9RVU6_PENBR|nr:hypothetical protein N7541_001057 [Penicillium brevicompactum]
MAMAWVRPEDGIMIANLLLTVLLAIGSAVVVATSITTTAIRFHQNARSSESPSQSASRQAYSNLDIHGSSLEIHDSSLEIHGTSLEILANHSAEDRTPNPAYPGGN